MFTNPKLMTIALLLSSLLFSCNTERNNHEKMIQILEENQKSFASPKNSFCPEAETAFFDSIYTASKTNNPFMAFKAQYYLANSLLKAGREQKAVEILEKMVPLATELYPSDAQKVLISLGIANIRLAERQNCVGNHNAESCILPIKNGGIHQKQSGSRRAIEVYKTLLEKQPNDYESRWMLNIAYMTLGEYPSGVPQKYFIPNLDKDDSGISIKPFEDVAPHLGMNKRNLAGGVIIDDFTNDGYDDIVISEWLLDGTMHFFKNNTNGTFTDISTESGLDKFRGGLNMIQADYNNDGLTDIFVMRGAWMNDPFGKQPNSLLRNNGDNTFTDVTLQSGLFSQHPTQAGVFRDFNNDGWLDLFIGNETETRLQENVELHGCELYLGSQKGTFTNIATEAGINVNSFIKGVASADYNNDGLQDIYISTMGGYKYLFKNKGTVNGKLTFEDVSDKSGVQNIAVSTFPTWFFDYDNDGWQDIFVCGYDFGKSIAASMLEDKMGYATNASKMYLYHNNHNGTFKDVSEEMGLNHSVFAMGSNFGDIDNDGYLDMYLGTGNPNYSSLIPNKLFKNMDGKKFADVTVAGRVGNLQKGHGVAFSDMDNDGDQDIFIEVGGAYKGDTYTNSLYMNPGQNDNRWIKLKLEATVGNRSAIGTKIKVTFRENGKQRTVYRELNSGGSFGSSPLRREIGIGQATIIDEIAITWSKSNKTQILKNIKPNQFLRIKEGENKTEVVNLKKLDFKTKDGGIPTCVNPIKTLALK